MTVTERNKQREKMHLEIAMSAAVAAGLAPDEYSARRDIEQILEQHPEELKAQWLRQRGGGIKGWVHFLRTFGFKERLILRRVFAKPASRTAESPAITNRAPNPAAPDHAETNQPRAGQRRALREHRLRNKLCVQCGEPADFLSTTCAKCAEAHRRSTRLNSAKKRILRKRVEHAAAFGFKNKSAAK